LFIARPGPAHHRLMTMRGLLAFSQPASSGMNNDLLHAAKAANVLAAPEPRRPS
jgi:hypothetical protein